MSESWATVKFVENEQFRMFMKNVQPAFQTTYYGTNMATISEESQKIEDKVRKEVYHSLPTKLTAGFLQSIQLF